MAKLPKPSTPSENRTWVFPESTDGDVFVPTSHFATSETAVETPAGVRRKRKNRIHVLPSDDVKVELVLTEEVGGRSADEPPQSGVDAYLRIPFEYIIKYLIPMAISDEFDQKEDGEKEMILRECFPTIHPQYLLHGIEDFRGRLVEHSAQSSAGMSDKLRAAAEEKAVGEMFARAREGVGLSKVAASKALGSYPKDIRNIENGEHSATLRKIREYADALGYDVQLELIPKGNE